ncbi:MAG: hypothetical protein A3F17_05960 [Gammaproteobacteria bacterium RIFCSPHIGHO2_12_FULL_41_15]|nr:MAG: hypothetical protein A3F17_05960 [Gammaproteobacteria bacterium RIFCSPHIGHO2_12_FULL_41_15]
MHRQFILTQLTQYHTDDPQQRVCRQQISDFIKNNNNCFERSNLAGHITASAWLLHPSKNKVLLMLHRKLNLWCQPGGHADGNGDIPSVALKEAQEETGIEEIECIEEGIFDIDIHKISPFNDIPAHWHYDIRYLLRAKRANFAKNEESLALRWYDLADLLRSDTNFDESLVRMAKKTVNHLGTCT